ncbi:MAG: hypothetical protein U5N56_11230 [Candidatus Marinimicrobia bacterium]|nr:hypothetical protein [Candidatus Neomarinimicrobiota bacterium]
MNVDPYLQKKEFLTDDLQKTPYPEIILGQSLANKLGVAHGDTVTLVSLLDIRRYNAEYAMYRERYFQCHGFRL